MARARLRAMSSDGVWSWPRRVLFRFGVVLGALFAYPFPIGLIPKTEPWFDVALEPFDWIVRALAAVLGQARPALEMTGSGDTRWAYLWMLASLILAAVGAAIWSVVDRRRLAYPRLAGWALVGLRYVLAFTMVSYGFAKIFDTQFPPPSYIRLDHRLGDMSPMGVLWSFTGSSTPYAVFGGLAEALGAALLLWRRTATLGALVVAAVMTNVVMLNFTYDVPVKLYATQLLVCALVIAAPQLRRLAIAVLGGAVAAVPPRPRGSVRVERARLAAKVAMLAAMGWSIYQQHQQWLAYPPPPGPLAGIWSVETWRQDGVEHPPLTTDTVRWRKLILDGGRGEIRRMTDERVKLGATVDAAAGTITVVTPGAGDAPPEVWRFTQPDPTHLIIDAGAIQATLVREPEPLLRTRGFHWIQEVPFNR